MGRLPKRDGIQVGIAESDETKHPAACVVKTGCGVGVGAWIFTRLLLGVFKLVLHKCD